MSIKIEIEAHPDRGNMAQQISNAMEALGYYPVSHRGRVILDTQEVDDNRVTASSGDIFADLGVDRPAAVDQTAVETTVRKRGEPSPGKARRTKAEIAEDEAADAAKIRPVIDGVEAKVNAAISTGAERIGPEDSEADAEQDAADEKAESDAKRTAGSTLDDLRQALGEYSRKFGMVEAAKLVEPGQLIGKPIVEVSADELPGIIASVLSKVSGITSDKPVEAAAEVVEATLTRDDVKKHMMAYMAKYGETATMADGPKIFGFALGDVPPGTKSGNGTVVSEWVLSAIPDDQESLKKAVTWWKTMLNQAGDTFGRKAVK